MAWSRWRPKLTRAHSKSARQKCGRTWKAWANSRKYPRFEIGINPGDVFSSYRPVIEAIKMHAGGIGSVWTLDLEEVDKLILMLEAARAELRKLRPRSDPS